ncbi:MAG: hypothetical protein AAGA47_06640 [Pseudomonadota bacterium]
MTRSKFCAFARDDSGAVTVDWVVLTAALVALGLAIATSVGSGTSNHADGLGKCATGMGKRLSRDLDRDNLTYERRLKRLSNACKNWAARN